MDGHLRRRPASFTGTAREILRVGFNSNIHPMGDLLFNPLAQPGDADEGNLYIAVGDGGAGETPGATHPIPQRLDGLPGKILRITPSISLRPGDELGPNGRYRIPTTGPDPNPFVSLPLPGVRKEIYAYGFRNPHRLSWDPVSNELIVSDIGLHSWEEVNLVTKGANHGYAEREGPEQLLVGGADNGKTGSQTSPPTPFPDPDSLSVGGIAGPVTPEYPVASYSHQDGDAISSGFVYRGALIPQLQGRFIFGDITTARLFHADWADMLASDDGNRTTQAAVHELQVVFDNPHDNPDQGALNWRLFDIVGEHYARRGGNAPGSAVLPGSANVTDGSDRDGIPYGGGRADIRLALGGDGEIYVLSKSDGMIRKLVALALPAPGDLTATAGNAQVTLSWSASAGAASYNVKRSTASGGPYATIATGVAATGHTDTGLSNGTRYYYVVSAVNGARLSVNSEQVSATPSGPTNPPTKDLVIVGLATSNGTVAVGGSLTVSYSVRNQGTATVTETYTDRLYLSSNLTIDAGDVLLGASHGHTADLAANALHAHSQTVTIPPTLPPGSYHLLVEADALGTVTESNDVNNVTAIPLTVTASTKDLVIVGLAASNGSVVAGGSLTVSYSVKNQGSATVTETYTDRLYLSANSTFDAGDLLLGASHGHTSDLAANALHAHSQTVTIPPTVAPGPYHLLVQADALGAVAESNDVNNVTAIPLTVTASTKDLVIVGLATSSGSVAAGGSLTVSYSVKNQGSATVTETYTDRLYLSANSTIDAGDLLLGASHGHTSDLAANGLHAHSQTVTIPPTVAPGSYHLLVQADALGAVAESTDANNVTAIPITVTP